MDAAAAAEEAVREARRSAPRRQCPPSPVDLLRALPPSRRPAPQASFVGEEVNNIIKEAIDGVLLNASYEHHKASQKAARAPNTHTSRP